MGLVEEPMERVDQTALLEKAREGDSTAYGRLIEPMQSRLLRHASALCRDSSTAEDLVSETLMEAWRSLDRYNGSCRFSTWLYAILLHRYQKTLRAARSRPVSIAWLPFFDAEKHRKNHEDATAAEILPAISAARAEAAGMIRQAIESLPEKHRAVILLRFFEEASMEEIGGVLSCSVGTVKSRLHHALEKLRGMQLPVNLSDWGRDT